MRKKTLIFFLTFIVLLNYPLPPLKASTDETNTTVKNILILNSYHGGFQWSDDETSGMLSSLNSLDQDLDISIEYMDWKRYPTPANLNTVYQSLNLKYTNKKIDLIITEDDAALSFAFRYRKELFSNAPIVFTGVNAGSLTSIANGEVNYTGVMETINPQFTIEEAYRINPSIDTLYVIYDSTESGLSTGKLCIDAALKINPNLQIVPLKDMNSSDILDTIAKASKNSMVLVTTYFTDTDGQEINHMQFCEKLSKTSPVPIYHLYDFALGSGIFGGVFLSGKDQGVEAAQLADQILNGKPASSIAIVDKETKQFTYDYDVLMKYRIPRSSLPSHSNVINNPFSFIETYRTLVYSVVLIFLLLLSFTIILLFYIRKINAMKLKLSENNEELTQLYEELTASEEELRAQYTEIIESHAKLEDYSDKLHHLAYHDILTGLNNRLFLYEEAKKDLDSGNGALLFIDLDNFKFVNDALGHSIGDELLQAISQRLLELSSETKILIRLGGDEFVFYIREMENRENAEAFAKKILKQFSRSFDVRDNYLTVTVSIGISLFPENGSDMDTLLRNADMAMYKVKNSGKNGFFFFNNVLKEELLQRVNIENNFKKALFKKEFLLHYQPQISIKSNTIDGFEALIRWNSPELGMLSPDKFISIAEETGFITTLGAWILKTSCLFTENLNRKLDADFKISVNISVIQLLQENFSDMVMNVLKDTGLSPNLLELEITESVIMESPELVAEKIKNLRSIGIRIALDDFGTGYSSLSYLRNIPITTLKIDKMFVDDIVNQNSNTDVTDTIIDLGHKMNLTIVAEGVETESQLYYLKNNGCDKIQGYFFSKPLPGPEIESLIEKFNPF